MPIDSEAYRLSQMVDENSGTYRIGELYVAVYEAMTAGKTNTANHGPLTEGTGTANAVTGGVSTQTQAGLSTQLAAGDGVLDVPTQTSTKSDAASPYNAAPMPDLSNITDLDIRTHEMLAAQAPACASVVDTDVTIPAVKAPTVQPNVGALHETHRFGSTQNRCTIA